MRFISKGCLHSITIRSQSFTSAARATPIRNDLSYYWETTPPSDAQLKYADRFFAAALPQLKDSATRFRTVIETAVPEVAFLGRSNVGKSSLLNALLGSDICHTSKRPGRTRSMNLFSVGGEDYKGDPKKLVVLDMPGYGRASQAEWGQEIMKYIVKRKQLRRAFVLVDATHGLKITDEQMLSLLRSNGVSHQIILSKIDRVLFPKGKITKGKSTIDCITKAIPVLDNFVEQLRDKVQPGLGECPDALGELVCTSADAQVDGKKLGIASLRWAVLSATGLRPKETVDSALKSMR